MGNHEFNAGATIVSMAEMRASPERTVQIIYEWEGFEWASRLWERWREELPEYEHVHKGTSNPHAIDRRIRAWLEARRPSPRPTDAIERESNG